MKLCGAREKMPKASNATWPDVIAMGLRYDLYCDPCGIHDELNMLTLPPGGNAVGVKFKCNWCSRLRM